MESARTKIEYVLFDMDGLLIDSEQVYSDVTNSILARYGKEMTWDIKAGCMGKPERAASEYLMSFFPDISLTVEDYMRERTAKQDLFWPTVKPLPGAIKLVKHLKAHGVPIAVATGSRSRNYQLKTSHLTDLFPLFDGNAICGDDPRLQGRGKPAPDVFLVAAGILGRHVGEGDAKDLPSDTDGLHQLTERRRGLIFEDATNGVEAGKRAGMNVVWVPDPRLVALNPGDDFGADQILTTLEQFKPEEWGLPPYPSQ